MKECNQCGKCCIKYGNGALSATKQEIEVWELFNPDIYQYVKNDDIWFDPTTGMKLTQCPFLEVESSSAQTAPIKYTCSIYLDRPEDCRHYPSLISEMIRDECEMIETLDITDYKKAQVKLDWLMRDSRPGNA